MEVYPEKYPIVVFLYEERCICGLSTKEEGV